MSTKTGIGWTDATWNPIRGCTRVSEGCRNCYAEKVAYRFSGPGQPYEGLAHQVNGHAAWTGKVELVEKHLLDPLKWEPVRVHTQRCDDGRRSSCICEPEPRSRRIFVNSMSDLFHESIPDEWIDHIFAVMALCPQHTFQVLTKRPERMRKYLSVEDLPGRLMDEQIDMADWSVSPEPIWRPVERALRKVGTKVNCGEHPLTGKDSYTWMPKIDAWPLPNLQLGVSVEDQETADKRILLLLQTPAAVRFLSLEPLLEDLGTLDLTGIHWVIVGGESGPGARPCNTEWVESIVKQCQTVGLPCFVKQLGACVIQGGERRVKRDKKGGDWNEWPHELRVREFPT